MSFNIDKARHSAKTFSLATGVNCFSFSCNNQEADFELNCSCGFCQCIQKVTDNNPQCFKIHKYASTQAMRFGGKYIYFCPNGFVHFVSPLINEGNMEGAIVGGPLLIIEHEEFFFEEILYKFNIPNEETKALYNKLKQIPFIQPQKVSSLSEMLYMVATYINQDNQMEQSQNMLMQQAGISDTIHRIKEQQVDIEYYPLKKERELLKKISNGDKLGANELLNEILGHIFFASGGKFDIIKARVLELLILLSRGALEGGADTEMIFGMNSQYLNEINGFTTIEQLTYWLSRIMVRFTECVFDFKNIKHSDAIQKAVEYIKRNYMRKITLEEVAQYACLSSSYFSKVFSDEMECNFNSFLNNIRIDNAKIMLMDETIPLVMVSELSGFEDQSYFTKVFKKNVGITPKKYKESRGRANS